MGTTGKRRQAVLILTDTQRWDDSCWYDMRMYLDELSPQERLRSRRAETILDDMPDSFTYAHRCSDRALDFLAAHAREDFLLVLSYDEPHGPFLCPKRFHDAHADFVFPTAPNVDDTLADKPAHLRVWARQHFVDDRGGAGVVRPDYFGLPMPPRLEGRSMLPTYREPARRANDAVFMEFARYEVDHDAFGGYQPIRCVCDGRYKLAVNLLTSDELYDLRSDPHELLNLIDSPDHAAARDRLHDRLLTWMNDTRDPCRGYYWERRPWRADARPATWLYTGKTRPRPGEEGVPPELDYNTGLEFEKAHAPDER